MRVTPISRESRKVAIISAEFKTKSSFCVLLMQQKQIIADILVQCFFCLIMMNDFSDADVV